MPMNNKPKDFEKFTIIEEINEHSSAISIKLKPEDFLIFCYANFIRQLFSRKREDGSYFFEAPFQGTLVYTEFKVGDY